MSDGAVRVAGGLSGRLDGLAEERRDAGIRAASYALGVLLAAIVGALGIVGAPAAGLAAACAAVAAWWWWRSARAARHEREYAVDDLILYGWEKAVPDVVEARRAELLCPKHRRRLARMLLTGTYAAPACAAGAGQQQALLELRRQRECVDRLVELLEDTSRPLDPRGVILVERLLADAETSPLHAGLPEALRVELERIDRLI